LAAGASAQAALEGLSPQRDAKITGAGAIQSQGYDCLAGAGAGGGAFRLIRVRYVASDCDTVTIQEWDPNETSHPIMPESLVPFYRDYIPFRCKSDDVKLKLALAALAARDQWAIEQITNPPCTSS
jgi:hypothetical protein